MILKRNFQPAKILSYVWRELLYSSALAALVVSLYLVFGWEVLKVPFTPIGILGSALAIFVAFRNNSSYGRWWEARTIWGGLVNYSRIFARLTITFVEAHRQSPGFDPARAAAFQREMVYRQIAFVHGLRLHLRGQQHWSELEAFLPEEEFGRLLNGHNKPNLLLQFHGKRIYDAMADGTLQGFDSFQLEGCLAQFANFQGACERIKNTPLPRQYDFFTRSFVWLFATLLPFGLLGVFPADLCWLTVPLSTLIALVFTIMEKTGALNEDPFENRITDIPLSALCNTIERDLREQLGESELPPKMVPVDGYLY